MFMAFTSSVGVEKDLALPADLADFRDGLDDPDFVVDRHDRNEHGVFPNRSFEFLWVREATRSDTQARRARQPFETHVQVQKAVGLHRQVGDIKSFLLEVSAAIQDALVLRLGGDYVLLLGLVELGDALDRRVV